jgi:hypothetical protein
VASTFCTLCPAPAGISSDAMLKRTFDPSTDSDSDQEAIDSALESCDDCKDRDSAEDED